MGSRINNLPDVAKTWANFVATLLLYESIFFLIMGTAQFSRNFWAIPAIYLSLIALFLMGPVWGMSALFAKKLIRLYAIAVLVLGLGSLISGATWDKVVGFDPYFVFRVSPVDDAICALEQLETNQAEKSVEKQIKTITKKMKNGGRVTTEEREFLQSQKEERDKRRIPARISGMSGKIFSSPVNASVTKPRDTQWMRWRVTKNPTQVIRVYDGDIFQYKSPKGFWVTDEYKNSYYHNPSKLDEVREFSFYDALPEGEIISIYGNESSFELLFRIVRDD
ncbi:MAG: hypothetical protein QME07_01025 [bacterium]|nr:hypothetical protein [bacterium]